MEARLRTREAERCLVRSRIVEWCRGIGGGCVELVVNETAGEPTDSVWGTFLCVFNAVIHNRVWILYIWEDVKFQVTFGLSRLSYYKDFWNKQEKKFCLGCVSTFLFWAWGVGGRQKHLLAERFSLKHRAWRQQSHKGRPQNPHMVTKL